MGTRSIPRSTTLPHWYLVVNTYPLTYMPTLPVFRKHAMQAMTPPSPASSLPPPPLLPKDTPTRVMKPLPVSADKSVKLRLQSNVVSSRYKSENRWNMNTDYSIPVRCRNGGTSKYADKNPSRAKRKRSASAQQKRDGLRSSRSAMQCSRTGPAAETFNGWVAIQIPDHPTWKRRYFMLDLAHSQLALFRSQRVSRAV